MGKAAPWFILAIMLFSYAVRAIYIESCSMFVRGGVYKVVHEAMGGTLAKFSVSALMFDYVLTGPDQRRQRGAVPGRADQRDREHLHVPAMHVYPPYFAAAFAAAVTIYFWRKNIIGLHESSEKALRIMQITTRNGGDPDRLVHRHDRSRKGTSRCRCPRSRTCISAPTHWAGCRGTVAALDHRRSRS